MNSDNNKIQPRSFHLVGTKVGEADYFLEKLKEIEGFTNEFAYILSAFSSAARSITFSLQYTMNYYPDFVEWYAPYQKKLKDNHLARYFLGLRNFTQKRGVVPVGHTGTFKNGESKHYAFFLDIEDLRNSPSGEVRNLAEEYLIAILEVIKECYCHYHAFVHPEALFTTGGLSELNWSIEDLEESVGLPRGYTDIDWDGDDKDEQRLNLLRREFQGDEIMEQYFA